MCIRDRYRILQEDYSKHAEWLKSLKDKPALTTDGHKISLKANISSVEDMAAVHDHGGEGIGLLRTELLFMGRESFPSEEEQFDFYKQIAGKSRQMPITVRTIDIGADKQ